MKHLSVCLFMIFAVAACSSPKTKPETENTQQYPDLTQLSKPGTQDYDQSKISVDSVKTVEQGLLIAGALPDGCSKLREASHAMQGDTLRINLSAWKPADKMCTQVLTPFTFIYKELSEQKITNAAATLVNGKKYIING